MWTLYFVYFVVFLFVNPKVIPDYRKIPERADTLDRIQDENSGRLRITKRDVYFDNISNETSVYEDTGTWSREVCEKTSRRRRLTPIVDERGERLLVLGPGNPASSIYEFYVDTHRCVQPGLNMVGGVNVKCEQQYIKFDFLMANAGQKIYKRSIWLPSGCVALREW